MTKDTTKESAVAAEALLLDDWFDAIEDGVRARARGFIETMLEEELSEALSRPRYGRRKPGEDEAAPSVVGVRHGHRERTLTGTFGKTRIAVPRARLTGEDGKTREWRSGSLRAYQRRTRAADALIAGAYLAGTNTRRVRRALNAVFAGPVGKDVVSRVWRKTKGDWDAWNARSLAEEPIVRLILDGTVARVRLDRRATSISLLVALGVRADGQKMLLAIKSMGGEGDRAIARGVQAPDQDFRPCCPAPKPPPCCSGRCLPQDRSPCARSTDGRPSPRNQTIRSLTSPHDRIASCRPKTRQSIPTKIATGPQEFNSLDNQREASEAYVKSQAHEGWKLVRTHYDDGGYSGGSMERPALQRLLDDVRARRIEVIVVYKVDRLTRSLADFAKLVELFEEHQVSFVSVTQAFNTTTSMGRLTLNVLLSFAQFEREVTGERIRDKIAASKRKGIWMGGVVPLGYRVENRALHVVEEHAVFVRDLFRRYLEVGSVVRLKALLDHEDARSPLRTDGTARP